jgi:hypothetical protein
MAARFLIAVIALLLSVNFAGARSIGDIPAAREALLRIVSPKFYRSLLISPVKGWIVVRGDLVNDHLLGPRVVHSELGGSYDKLALELAQNLQIVDYTRPDLFSSRRAIFVHLLIYEIADGAMAMSFAHLDESGGNQLRYSGAAWMAVEKTGRWITIEPRQLTPHERRGPRTYTLAVEAPGSTRSLQGNGRPSLAAMSVRGGPVTAAHSTRVR